MRRRALVVLALALPSACAGLDGLTGGGKNDPPTDGGSTPNDSGIALDGGGSSSSGALDGGVTDSGPPTCDRSGPFTSITPVSGLPVGAAEVVLTADELEIFFTMPFGDAGQRDVKRATRGSPTGGFGAASDPLAIHLGDEQPYVVVSGGLTLVGALGGDPGFITRPATSQPFGSVQRLDVQKLGGFGTELVFVWMNDAQTAAYGVERGFLDSRVVRYLAAPGNLTLPVDLGLSSAGAQDAAVVLTEDELQMFVTSKRTGSAARDVYVTSRADKGAAWGPLTLVSELNTSGDDSMTSLSRDGCVAYGVRSNSGGGGGALVYRAEKPKK